MNLRHVLPSPLPCPAHPLGTHTHSHGQTLHGGGCSKPHPPFRQSQGEGARASGKDKPWMKVYSSPLPPHHSAFQCRHWRGRVYSSQQILGPLDQEEEEWPQWNCAIAGEGRAARWPSNIPLISFTGLMEERERAATRHLYAMPKGESNSSRLISLA